MTTRLRMNDLRKIILTETKKIILEAEKKEEKGENSLDAQIDKYFANYESEGKNSKNEGLDFRSFVRRFLREAEEDTTGEESKEEDEEQEEKQKLTSEDIDINSFVDNVVRLTDNYDSLLEVRNTILRRAINFLLKGYEVDVADSFKESLLERHGLEVGQSKYDHESEDFQAPPADRAGVSPGGG